MAFAELEITLDCRADDTYAAELRFSLPDSEVETARGPAPVRIDFDALRGLSQDGAAYGRLLAGSLFEDAAMRAGFAAAKAAAELRDLPLRIRLLIQSTAMELHGLRWETLRDPDTDTPLAIGKNILLSRYIVSVETRLEPLLAKRSLTALVAVAAAPDLEAKGFPALDAAAETARARSALGQIPVTALHETGPVTLERISAALDAGPHVLYLVAHGVLSSGGPRLWLQGDDGLAVHVPGEELVNRIRELATRPRLVVLASCESGGAGTTPVVDDGTSAQKGNAALAAIGPRLAEAGVAAVIAMQGKVRVETAQRFTETLFSSLDEHGLVDLAAAEARSAIRYEEDWWSPALYTRLKRGRLWYTPGFGEDAFRKWDGLLNSIRQGACTAILGPDLTESLVGSRRDIARRLAEAYNFPLSEHHREDLPQVAQYIAVDKDRSFLLSALPRSLFATLRERFALTPDLCNVNLEALPDTALLEHLDAALQVAAVELRGRPGSVEPSAALAKLKLPLYINTSPDNLLIQALKDANRAPAWEICRWYPGSEVAPLLEEREPNYIPSPDRPLVYQLFGHLSDIGSLVITEDAYFRFLRGVTANRELIPTTVTGTLVNSALLFLGFQLDDWNFRILYHGIIEREGQRLSERFTHVAAQIDPEQGNIDDPERARRYLEEYFKNALIHIFWGSAEDFLRELQRRL